MTSADTPILEVKDMCKNFGVTVALNHVNLTLKSGEIRGLIGENGSGSKGVQAGTLRRLKPLPAKGTDQYVCALILSI